MSATFACPHCGATYPRKPVLVGRTVRCTTCKNAFRLREDGIADKVEPVAVEVAAPTAAQPAAAQPAPPAPQPAARPHAPAKPAIIPLTLPPELTDAPPMRPAAQAIDLDTAVEVVEPVMPAPSRAGTQPPASDQPGAADQLAATGRPSPKSSASGPARTSDRFTAQQQEARRAMAATLSTSMTAALKAESVKREVEADEKTRKKSGTEGRVGKIGPAILTGEGLQQARLRRTWFLIALVLVALVGGCSWLVAHRSPQRHALEAYAAVVEGQRNRYERVQAIQERAWLVALPPAFVGVPAMMDMGDARIGGTRTIKLAAAKPLFDQLKGLVLSERAPVWVPKDRLGAVEAAIRPGQREQDLVAGLARSEKGVIPYRDWQDKLVAAGLSKDDVDTIDLLLRGKTKRSGENEIAARLLAGDLPDAIEIAAFAGRKGLMVVSRGQAYEPKPVRYEGNLLRFVGKDWPVEWKVLTISAALITD
jgi:hypothetical protein